MRAGGPWRGRHLKPVAWFRMRGLAERGLEQGRWNWDARLDAVRFVVFDLETTGLRPWEGDEMVELGALAFSGGDAVEGGEERFHSFADPGRLLPPEVTGLTGIRQADLESAPHPRRLVRQFLDWAGPDAVLVAHGLPFDMAFLRRYLPRRDTAGRERPALDTAVLGRALHAGPDLSLDRLAEHYGVTPRDRHRALGDAETAARVFRCMLARLEQQGVGTLLELFAFLNRLT